MYFTMFQFVATMLARRKYRSQDERRELIFLMYDALHASNALGG